MNQPIYPKQQVRKLRQRLGMNQRAFAEMLGVTQGLISQWENPEREDSFPAGPAAILLKIFASQKKTAKTA